MTVSTVSIGRQFRILMWKNFVLRRRRPLLLAMELISPVAIIIILALVRTRQLRENMLPCHIRPKPLPTGGTLPWLQSSICNFNNTCNSFPYGLENNSTNTTSAMTDALERIQTLLASDSMNTNSDNLFTSLSRIRDLAVNSSRNNSVIDDPFGMYLSDGNETRERLSNASIQLSDTGWQQLEIMRMGSVSRMLTRPRGLSSTLNSDNCSLTEFVTFLNVSSASEVDRLHNDMCNFTTAQTFRFVRIVSQGIDAAKLFNASTNNETRERLRAEAQKSAESFNSIVSTLGDMVEILRDLRPTNQSENTTQIQAIFGLICGEDSDIYKVMETQADFFTLKEENKTTTKNITRSSRKRRSVDKESDECKSLWGNTGFKLLLSGVEPFLARKIYYTPNNNITKTIIEQSNFTFSGLISLGKASELWRTDASDNIRRRLYNGTTFNFIRSICSTLNNTELCNFLDNNPNDTNQFTWQTVIDMADSFFLEVEKAMQCFDFNKYIPMETESEMVGVMNKREDYWAGIVFEGLPKNTNATIEDLEHVTIRIRMNTSWVDGTVNFKVTDRYWSPGIRRNPYSSMKYFYYGFINLQDILGRGVRQAVKSSEAILEPTVIMQQFPYPCYVNDRFTRAISSSLPLFLVLGWIVSISMTVRSIVYEKEHRMKEVMKVMGLSNGVHWISWFTTTSVLMTASAAAIAIIMKLGRVLYFSSGIVVFLFLFSFMMASIMQAFLISVFFGKANIAAVCAGLLYFVFYLPFIVVQINEESINEWGHYGFSLFAQVAFSIGCRYLAQYEQQGVGIQFNNIGISSSSEDSFNLGKCIGMLWLDALLYWLATWYIEAVFPGTFGVPRVWYFPFTRDYWCGRQIAAESLNQEEENTSSINGKVISADQDNFESGPKNGTVGVSIKKLCKVYGKGTKPAVDNLDVDFYENQITSFLGHNGAGKTTTISILTGLFTPTSGTAYIYGRNIATDMDAIRHNLGLCPQHNVLFEYLNVEEHIYFYGLLKGMDPKDIQAEITKFVKDVGLPHKRKELSMKLSGGMKRKLSVAMAFVGGSKVVVLDEPTAGVDPYARRSIWELLVSCRKDRTIILTTHHMDEADVLGDRIAIISQGSLKCCGSSVFLKNLIGSGYNLIMVKNEEIMDDLTTSTLTEFITNRVAGATLIEESSTEWLYQLPHSGLNNGEFQELFEALDATYTTLGVSSYGISDTSLEEVFLHVAHDPSDEFNKASIETLTDGGTHPRPVSRDSFRKNRTHKTNCLPIKRVHNSSTEFLNDDDTEITKHLKDDEGTLNCGAGSYQITGCPLIRMQFSALWIKRFHNMRRNKRGFVAELVVPVVFILLAVILSSITGGIVQNPPMQLEPWLLQPKRGDPHLNVFYSNGDISNNVTEQFVSMTRTPLGLGGVRCMNTSVYNLTDYQCGSEDKLSKWSSLPQGDIPLFIPFCDCSSTGNLKCPQFTTKPSSKLFTPTTDYLHNLTGFNISDWILATTDEYVKRRYGGFVYGSGSVMNSTGLVTFVKRLFGGDETPGETNFWDNINNFFETALPSSPYNVTTWFDNSGYMSAPAYLAILQNSIFRFGVPEEKASRLGMSFVNHPMNLSEEHFFDSLERSLVVDMLVSICVVFALAFIPASFLLFLIDERVSNSKHLQFVSGVNPYIYWIANYVWDIMNYIFPCFICIIIFAIFDRQSYISSVNVGPFILLLLMYGITIIPLMYLASFVFSTPSTAFVVVSSINLMLGMVSTLAVFIIQSLEEGDEEMKQINNFLKKFFLVLPQYCLGRGLFELSQMHLEATVPEFGTQGNPLEWDHVGKNLFCLLIQCFVFIAGVCLVERRCFCSQRQGRVNPDFLIDPADQDDDVIVEQNRVLTGGADGDPVRLVKLTKVYPGKKQIRPAVNHLTLSIRKGECFGFLGVNGAGKTTTFKMLTGQESVTRGNAFVSGFSIISDMVSVHKKVGYCPQFDALNNLLTGRETLWLYARLRGIPKLEIEGVVHWALGRLSLMPHADKPAGLYSGGNKRKLSTAVALIGNPDVIFLDEPTSGMDPGAKRFLWNCILRIVKEGRSVVLTTHSMEECEALSQRLCIMVNGALECLGSVQHLKNKFGKGYTLALKLDNMNPQFDEVVAYISDKLPTAQLKESNYTLLQYEIMGDLKLSETFAILQIAKNSLGLLEDYSISQTTLDQVFINFAKNQSELLSEDTAEPAPEEPADSELPEIKKTSGNSRKNTYELESNTNAGFDNINQEPITPVMAV